MASPAITNSVSTTQTVLANPISSIASNIDYTSAQQIALTAGAIATQTASQLLFGKLKTQLTTAGALRYKVATNTASTSEIAQYSQTKGQINKLIVQINATGSVDADTQAAFNNELQQAKLKQIAGSPGGTITTATFTDFLDFVFRTQAINPYSRERTCDVDFIDMLSNIASDIGDSKAFLNELVGFITKSIS